MSGYPGACHCGAVGVFFETDAGADALQVRACQCGFCRRHGAKTVFIARFVTGLRVFGALLAGSSGLEWRRFLFYNATGAVVWSTAVATAGYLLAYSWETLERWIGRSRVPARRKQVGLDLEERIK